ncbi:hypothetical protein BX659_11467 [Orenia metallireducens]|uniref:Uncharacterized protein n=2 Tax=Orenia metallireducens TaxID=1413210 RepID=A0A285IBS8_9FIRM|nr:hypothetical protein [Orenia metallireducens]PRX28017.1 hypothetical protein BX659_11467 [Orenia metallireducens]SNY45422.1 hypothetical protein SAMN06265827_1388 [Orenia metallireducens]
MKKYFLMIFMLLLINASAFASGSLNAGKSEPANLVVYRSKSLSTAGYWDLSDYKLPAKAVITGIKVKWDYFSSLSNQRYSGLELYLYNQKGKKVLLKNNLIGSYASTDKFNGELPKQKWKLRYKVKDFKYEGSYFAITPQLIIYYEFKKDKED